MAAKEAQARIKLNKLLEEAGWRFFDDSKGRANIVLEPKVKLTKAAIDALGENFEATSNGFIDFLLLDESGFPLVVLEAKAEDKNPLIGKEQARKYAKAVNSSISGSFKSWWMNATKSHTPMAISFSPTRQRQTERLVKS